MTGQGRGPEELGAFCPGPRLRVAGASAGPLRGVRFAAKDLFDVAGHRTGAGNPDWLRTHPPARTTAPAVRRLLDAGADLEGKTITDELAFSLNGRNAHYGTPINPAAEGRIPGGSSAGSASAVAGGRVDCALGTDTGGSVRVPAALCGVHGIRPTHGAVPIEGVVPLAPGFDVVGWFARDASLLPRIGEVLLPPDAPGAPLETLLVAEDAFSEAEAPVRAALGECLERAGLATGRTRIGEVGPTTARGLARWAATFRTIQGREIWSTHGAWIEQVAPRFAPDVAERFRWASTIPEREAREAADLREAIADAVGAVLASGAVLLLPAAPTVALRLDASAEEIARYRDRTLRLTSVAGLARTPQVVVPAGTVEDGAQRCPVGLGLVARRGADRALLDLARVLSARVAAGRR